MNLTLAALLMLAAQAGNASLVDAERAYRLLDYDRVQRFLEKARTEPATHDEQVRIIELTAIMDAIYGRQVRAKQGFRTLLKLNPDYTLPPTTSPKILEALAAARVQSDGESGRLPDTESEVADNASQKTLDTPVRLPRVANLTPEADGLPLVPLPLLELAPAPQPFYMKAWFWAAVGGAVAVTTAVLIVSSTHAPAHDVGPFELR